LRIKVVSAKLYTAINNRSFRNDNSFCICFRMIWKGSQALVISLAKIDKYLNTFNGLSIMTTVLNVCFRIIVLPTLITTASVVFSITSAMIIIMNNEIFHSLSTILLPILVIESGFATIFGPTMCSFVYKKSLGIKMMEIKGSSFYYKTAWLRKKERSMRPIKIYIGDCYFDREMPLITVNNNFCNAISVLLGVRK